MKLKRATYILISCFFIFSIILNCKKNKILSGTSYDVNTSIDTLLFDTLFTTIGSTTKYFKCYNNHNGVLKISNLYLEGGTYSPFRINVDGISGVDFENIEILPNDSIFIFVEVTIDPNGLNQPLVIEDKIIFNTNGNQSQVLLNAWGQDAYFHVNEIVDGIWSNDKPHVIYGLAAVGYPALDSNLSLTIDAGTKIYGHTNASLFVYKSSLIVNGELNSPVVFQQDRIEDYLLYPADSVAGQWRGIYFSSAQNSNITHAEIKNAVIGIQVDTFLNNSIVNLEKVKVNNSLYSNILTQGGNVNATNCLFGNSNNYSAYVSIGGEVKFEHCTFANYANNNRNNPALIFKDYYVSYNEQTIIRPFTSAEFINCIIDGNSENELFFDTLDNYNNNLSNIIFDHCAIKAEDSLNNVNLFNSCFLNLETNFSNSSQWDFDLTNSSEVIDIGTNSAVTQDILERPRSAPNDLGCYELQ